jgi:DNA-directed RNA polymerase subunit RPC12/RpoP
MTETIGAYLRRRYRWALAGIVGGALGALLAGSLISGRVGAEGLAFQAACAVIWGGALLVAARTRCPRCRARLVEHVGKVIPQTLSFSLGTPVRRCPRCGVRFDEPAP